MAIRSKILMKTSYKIVKRLFLWDYGTKKPVGVTYPHIYDGNYTDQNGKNWAAIKEGDSFSVPEGSLSIKDRVGYDGIAVHVYIWMEGTDADCVNGKSVENDDSKYSVTVKFAGVASGN